MLCNYETFESYYLLYKYQNLIRWNTVSDLVQPPQNKIFENFEPNIIKKAKIWDMPNHPLKKSLKSVGGVRLNYLRCFNDLHPENIYVIVVTECELKLDKSKDIIFEQFRNI